LDFVWIRENGKLTHIDPNIEIITGWTVEEIMTQPLTSLVASSTLQYIKDNYYTGPPGDIVPQRFPVHLLHKDGYEVCCRAIVVCCYGDDGFLVKAHGVLKCDQSQCVQNELLDIWPYFEETELGLMEHMLRVHA